MMSRLFMSAAWVLAGVAAADAQPPGFPPGGFGRPAGFRGPPGFTLMAALDRDQNGKISSAEIDGAVAALRQLDKNQDGKLSGEEIGWPPSFGGRGGFGRGGFRGGRGRGGFGGPFGGAESRRLRRPDPDASAPDPRGAAVDSPRRFFSSDQLHRLDRNADGVITKDEIPSRMQELILGRVDSNDDDVITSEELTDLANETEAKP